MDIDGLVRSDWDYFKTFLPDGWDGMMAETGMLKFGRKFSGEDGPSKLLRTLLIHLGGNLSLRSTCALAKEGNIIDVSDVALLKRLQKSSEWFNWCTTQLLDKMKPKNPQGLPEQEEYNFRYVDGSIVREPGATGSTWRLHYSMNAKTLAPDEITITDQKKGESLKNYSVKPNDVFIGDRVYPRRNGIIHVHSNGGYILCRFPPSLTPLHNDNGTPFKLLSKLRKLKLGDIGEYNVVIKHNEGQINARVCAMKKDHESTLKAQKAIHRKASKNSRKGSTRPETLEYAGYILILTTLPESVSPEKILNIYRSRWQIELLFKRLKSIIGAAPLYKKNDIGMRSWLAGKILVATLIEYIIRCGEDFFPWGYPIKKTIQN